MQKVLVPFVFAAGVFAAVPAAAQFAPEMLAGTWECYGPGQTHPQKPPIVFFGATTRDAKGSAAIEVDGFERTVAGSASVAADADGWTRISPASGDALFVRGVGSSGAKVSMQLRRDGVGSYRCVRLPRYDQPMIPRDRVIEEKNG